MRGRVTVVVVGLSVAGCSALTDLSSLGPADGAPDVAVEAACPSITRVSKATTGVSGLPKQSVSLLTNVTAGDLVVAALAAQLPGTLTLADTAGMMWTTLPEATNPTCSSDASPFITRAGMAYAVATTSLANDTVTFSTSQPSDYLVLTLAEYANTAPLPRVTSSHELVDGGSSFEVGPLATPGCTNLVFALLADESGSVADSWTPFPGFDIIATEGIWSYAVIDDTTAPAGSVVAGGTRAQSDGCGAAIATSFAPP